jgi:hypothetical protein
MAQLGGLTRWLLHALTNCVCSHNFKFSNPPGCFCHVKSAMVSTCIITSSCGSFKLHVLTSLHAVLHVMTSLHADLHVMTSLHADLHVMTSLHADLHVMTSLHADLHVMTSLHADLHVITCKIGHSTRRSILVILVMTTIFGKKYKNPS